MKEGMIDGVSERERNMLAQEDFAFVHQELFYLIKERQVNDIVALTGVITDINPNQLPKIKKVLLKYDEENIIPENKINYAFFCDALGIDPSK